MIKMTIGGEEVVCNKEFTIKEEMLSTSSTILNNCYPKTWEQDHDYVSRFYYPKDYSQCLIYNNTEAKTITNNGQTITFDDLINPTIQDLKVYGNTLQNGTPSPTEPVPIQTITGTQTIQVITNNQTNNYTINLGDLELCKIDTFQDYLYKENGNWYKKSLVGKVVLDGSENWSYPSANRFNVDRAIPDNNYFRTSSPTYYCDKYKGYNKTDNNRAFNTLVANESYGFNFTNNYNNNTIRIKDTRYTSLDDFKAYLSNNNLNIYYSLLKPTQEQITDENLISQLEKLSLKKGNNEITTTINLLPFDLEITVYDSGVDFLFSGVVKNTGNINLNPRYPKYCALEILDFKDFLSTGETLDFVINEKTVQEAIEMVVNAVGQYGFVLGNINILNPNDVIGAYSTQNKSAYDVLQYLADISQSRWSTRMIDENTIAIDFYDPTLMPSGIDIDYTKEWWCQNKVIDLTWNYGTRDYRNKQVMLSDKVFAGTDYNETIITDGYNTSFMTTSEIGLMKSILVNGESVSFATNEDKEIGIDAEFYYTPGENTITTDNSYSSGTQIVVTYTPLVKGREVIYNTDEVNRINLNTGRKGVIARYEQRNDVLSSDELEMIGQTYLKYKGSAEVILTLKTQEDIYNIGQTVYFNAPIQELATSYMVKKKSTEIIATTGDVFYTYELTSSFNSETAINWFDNQRNKTTGNIAVGEYITRNYDIENTANIIWDNLTITEVNVTGTNVLNAPLNSPFVE